MRLVQQTRWGFGDAYMPHGDPLTSALRLAQAQNHCDTCRAYAAETTRIRRLTKLAQGWEPSGLEYRERPTFHS